MHEFPVYNSTFDITFGKKVWAPNILPNTLLSLAVISVTILKSKLWDFFCSCVNGFCIKFAICYSYEIFSLVHAELFRNYLKQIREETSGRLLSVAYRTNGTPNKWWLAFAKRKFMNIIALWNSIDISEKIIAWWILFISLQLGMYKDKIT